MTATATAQTLRDVMCALEISPSNLVQTCQIRENLQHFVTLSGNRQVFHLAVVSAFCMNFTSYVLLLYIDT